jgi:hypothetical protein
MPDNSRRFMSMPTTGAVQVAISEPRTFASLLLEVIALRHQIAVLKHSQTSSPELAEPRALAESESWHLMGHI